ncbi:hypothetical protein [Nocardia tengchongensis]|uniref:hypothetical protein n=1 Tax=Nocardia tengchongensis TaxID=2055889 RepID=UPI00360C0C0D
MWHIHAQAGSIPNSAEATPETTFNLLRDELPYISLPGDYKSPFVDVRNREVRMTDGSGFVGEAESM